MPARVKVIALLSITVLVLGACGGDDDDPQSAEEELRELIEDGNLDEDERTELQEEVDETTGDEGDLPDACELVTTEDAAGLFGEPAVETEDTSPVALGVACIYENADSETLGVVGHLLQVRVFDGEQFYGAEAFDDEEAIDDLGDEAFVRTSEGLAGGVEVQFVEDGKTVTFSYSTVNIGVEDEADEVNAADHEDAVVALARQAAERMG